MAAYAHPEVLVDTSWVKGHIGNETVRIVEVDYDPTPNYNLGHIPGSVLIDWKRDINDPVRRDIVSKEGLEALFGRLGISNDHRIVLYGDFNNWFAAFAFWVFKYYGVDKVVLLNGGRKKWIEEDLPVTRTCPHSRRRRSPRRSRTRRSASTSHTCGKRTSRPARSSSTYAGRKNSAAKSSRRRNIRRSMPSVAATFPGRRTSPGPKPSTRTGRSRRRRS